MVQTIPATQVKNRFGTILRQVYGHKDHIIVEKSGITVAAIVPISVYKRIYGQRQDVDPSVAKKLDYADELTAADWKSNSEAEGHDNRLNQAGQKNSLQSKFGKEVEQ